MLTEGVDLRGATDARVEAARRIGELLKSHAADLWIDQEWQMDITDHLGLILYVIHVQSQKAPATMDKL
jgi:hypothetical protein